MITFLMALAGSVLAPLLVEGFLFLWPLFKGKKPTDSKGFVFNFLLSASVAFTVSLILFVFEIIFFNLGQPLYEFLGYFCISLFISMFRFGKSIREAKKHKDLKPLRKKTSKCAVFLAVYLLLESFAFNGSALKKENESVVVSPTDSSYVITTFGFDVQEDNSVIANNSDPYLILGNMPESVNNFYFSFGHTNTQMELIIYGSEDCLEWDKSVSYDLNCSYDYFCHVAVPDQYSFYKFVFNLETTRATSVNEFTLCSVTINCQIGYRFGVLRFLAVWGLAFLASKIPELAKKNKTNVEPSPTTRSVKFVLMGGLLVSFVAILVVGLVSSRGASSFFVDYPLSQSDLESSDIYAQLFDAFRKGQLNLDLTVDEKLLALGDDAYIPTARSQAGATGFWDHAFYNGKYYSYFGAAPVILVSFPIYFIFGVVPTGLFLQVVAVEVIFFAFIYIAVELTEIFRFKPNPIAYGLAILALLFGGLFFNLIVFRKTDFQYRVPFDYAIMGILLFVLFLFEAYKGKKRMLYLTLAGLSFVITVGSRPDFGAWLIFLMPFLIKMLLDREGGRTISKNILVFLPMFGVLCIGGGVLLAYNYARYGNIFEFGTSYQITSFDARTFTLSLDSIRGGIFHYWLQLPSARDKFGFISTSFTHMYFDYHPYRSGTIGILASPTTYLWLLLPFCLKKEDKWEWKAFFALIPISLLVISVYLYSMAGTCFRYMLAIYPLLSFSSLVVLAKFISTPMNEKGKTMGYSFSFAALVGSFLFGANLISVPFDGMRGCDLNGILYYGLREIFGAYNI